MKRYLMLAIMTFFLLTLFTPNVNAADRYEQGTDIDLKFSYGEFSACAANLCNVTIALPSSVNLVENQPTTQNLGYANYSLNSSQTAITGFYDVFLISENGSFYDTQFQITPNGEVPTEANAIFYIGLLALLVVFFGLFVYFGVTTDHIWVKAASWGFGYLLLIGISFISWNMAADFLTSSPFLVEFLRVVFLVFMIGFFPFLLALFVYGVYMMITIKEIKSMIDRGIPEGEAVERSSWKK